MNGYDRKPMESHARSWAKSLSWRVVGVVMLGGISYAITRNWQQTTVITAIFHVLRTFLYYYHERLWERVAWGRYRHPLSCLPVKETLSSEDYEELLRLLRERDCLEVPNYEI